MGGRLRGGRAMGGVIAALALLVPVAGSASSADAAAKPHIVLSPNNVMVNTTVKVVGTHFPAKTSIVLRECGAKTWIAPKDPCNKKPIRVTTNKHGRFSTSFTAKLCPRTPWAGHPVTEERCYVGELKPSGVDVINLVGHARLIVTYP